MHIPLDSLVRPSLFGLFAFSRKRFKNEEGSCSISFLLYTLFYLPCSVSPLFYPSCVPNRLPLSRVDYRTDDSSRIESNRVDSTNSSALPVSQIDFRLVESTTRQTIRVESGRFDQFFCPSCVTNRLPVSRIDYNTDDSSRIATTLDESTRFNESTLP